MEAKNPYQEAGFESRNEYLADLARSYGLEPIVVYGLADIYGPNEDFDGLLTAIEDMECGC